MQRNAFSMVVGGALWIAAWLPCAAQGAEQAAEIMIRSAIQPAQAVGLILSPSGSRQAPDAEILKASPGEIAVAVPYDDAKLEPGTLVTAVAAAEDGAYALGAVKSLPPPGQPALGEVPPCEEAPAGPELASALTAIQKLEKVRRTMRDTVRQRLQTVLNEDLAKKLAKLEKGFGLEQAAALSDEEDPFRLVDRLAAILNALKTYKFFKKVEPQEGGEQ